MFRRFHGGCLCMIGKLVVCEEGCQGIIDTLAIGSGTNAILLL